MERSEDVSRRTIAVSIKATKLTGRVLAQACLAVGRKIKKAHRARQTPHGKQTVRQPPRKTDGAPAHGPRGRHEQHRGGVPKGL